MYFEKGDIQIDYAYKYKKEIDLRLSNISMIKPEYIYYNINNYLQFTTGIEKDEYRYLHRVIKLRNKGRNNRLLAYIFAYLDRVSNAITELGIVSLVDHPSPAIIKGLKYFIEDVAFKGLKFRKITFTAIAENPANKIYNRYIYIYLYILPAVGLWGTINSTTNY